MSHYCVLVLTDEDTSVEELLAPYDENISVEPYVLYTKDELIAHLKENGIDTRLLFTGMHKQKALMD